MPIFGAPTEVISDRGLHNRGDFSKGLSSRGVIIRNIGVESPEQLGRVERHGGILKGMMQRIIHKLGLSGELQVKQALSEALSTKSSQSRIKGFTPTQWVFGQLPKEPGMASDDKLDLGILEAMADKRRKAAPITKEYGVGDLVCFKLNRRDGRQQAESSALKDRKLFG